MKRTMFAVIPVLTLILITTAVAEGSDYLPINFDGKKVYKLTDDYRIQILRYFDPSAPSAVYHSDLRIDGVVVESVAMNLSNDSDGNIYCHGGCWTPFQATCSLDPPELLIMTPLVVGNTWESTCNSSAHGPMTFTSQVLRFEKITVPAGVFECYVIERCITTFVWSYTSYEWYSEGVGIVKFSWPWVGTFELLPGTDVLGPQRNQAKSGEEEDTDTWGGVKALYK